jgi:hypothetical protein
MHKLLFIFATDKRAPCTGWWPSIHGTGNSKFISGTPNKIAVKLKSAILESCMGLTFGPEVSQRVRAQPSNLVKICNVLHSSGSEARCCDHTRRPTHCKQLSPSVIRQTTMFGRCILRASSGDTRPVNILSVYWGSQLSQGPSQRPRHSTDGVLGSNLAGKLAAPTEVSVCFIISTMLIPGR